MNIEIILRRIYLGGNLYTDGPAVHFRIGRGSGRLRQPGLHRALAGLLGYVLPEELLAAEAIVAWEMPGRQGGQADDDGIAAIARLAVALQNVAGGPSVPRDLSGEKWG